MEELLDELKDSLRELLKRCNRCGFCLEGCPTYPVSYQEWHCTRGRIDLIDCEVDNFKVPGMERSMKTCLLCGKCELVCPSRVEIQKIIKLYRHYSALDGRTVLPGIAKLFISRVLPNPLMLNFCRNILATVQGGEYVNGLLIHAGGKLYNRLVSVIPPVSRKSARQRLKELVYRPGGESKGAVVYFLGCMADHLYPQLAVATLTVLLMEGYTVHVPPVNCCGLPASVYGLHGAAERMAVNNVKTIPVEGIQAVISDCPSCVSMLQQYASFVKDRTLNNKAAEVGSKATDLGTWLYQVSDSCETPDAWKEIAYHHPCHLQHRQNTAGAIRVLKQKGFAVRETDDMNQCCGGAGSYTFLEPQFSDEILSRKIRVLKNTGVKQIVTSCPACMMQLEFGAGKENLLWEVKHLSQALAGRNVGFERLIADE